MGVRIWQIPLMSRVHEPAEIRGNETEDDPNDGAQAARQDADQRGLPHAHDHLRKEVTAEKVRSQEELRARRLLRLHRKRIRVTHVDGEQADHGERGEQENDKDSDGQALVPTQVSERELERAGDQALLVRGKGRGHGVPHF